MQQIINFIIRNKTFLLFLLLFSLSLFFTFQSHSYHRSKFINSANFLTGGVYESVNNISGYFGLKKENEILLEENNRLKSILMNTETGTLRESYIDSSSTDRKYKYTPAQVFKNSYSLTNNYLTINKGKKDSIKVEFGVITSKGIVGVIDKVSKNYGRVRSILNASTKVNAQLKKSNHFGTLMWNGKSPYIVQLTDLPKQATFVAGDTIITGGLSTIFPKGIPIGTIASFNLDETENYFEIDVALFNDMTDIGHVYIIENLDAEEISNLNNLNE
ncbi:rod shape-determining protein MreC [Pontimicrobium aquaticum]|uniref:Cell shape-determining protein MreC n=1 Tax=Pontimicrobium aquaticum TaxID=2565367 RepID=A0A4U0EZX5_9FLAO|nr:rod shape-determining protein MreC [Pontimicrobium aquaticum]TJY37014.1 rod shape-determining protein MreC [Pontimicrobium aquaticum]